MTELKTLKDLNGYVKGTDSYSIVEAFKLNALRKEAIKDIKAMRGEEVGFKNGHLNFSCDPQDQIEEYIKWKFNIKEDDLT